MKIKNLKLKILASVIACILASIHVSPASAEGISLGISPPLIKIKAKSPSLISTPIIIQNLSSSSVTLEMSLEPFKPKNSENGTLEYYSKEERENMLKDPFYKAITLREQNTVVTEVQLGPRQEKTVVLSLDISTEAVTDYYFSVLFITKDVESVQKNSDTYAKAGIATNVLVSLGTDTKPQGHLSEFSSPGFVEVGPLPFVVKVTNTGENVIAPTGTIYIKNMFGQLVGKVDLQQVNILKDSTRSIPDKNNSTNTQAVWNEEFLLGQYSAELAVDLGPDGPSYRKKITFLAFPIKLGLGIVVALFLFFVIRSGVKKRLK